MNVANRHFIGLVLLIAVLAAAAAVGQDQAAKQRELIAVLQSNAASAEKAITCKQLAIYGTEEAVPSLMPLRADKELASWARIALEVIPGPAADESENRLERRGPARPVAAEQLSLIHISEPTRPY